MNTPEANEAAITAGTLVVVSNRLPVDRVTAEDGTVTWRTSPGGLVTAMEPVVRDLGCVWVGWPGNVAEELAPFSVDSMELRPVSLDAQDFKEYYEGFSNDTIWPLYHDVISAPAYHREWWDRYVEVNRKFALAAAEVAEPGATVWVHDYQLQLVPAMLREARPDLTIGFFLHIPFPSAGLFSQLPWRRRVLEGMLGADVIGFQRVVDAANFRASVRRYVGAPSSGNLIHLPERDGSVKRRVLAQDFPISIDANAFQALAQSAKVRKRAREIRKELGNPKRVILGVDRLDYTKGIRHRLKAFAEILRDDEVAANDITLVQVASPSRERVEAYRQLRDEIEITVSRINGDYGTIAHSPVMYLHQGVPREEMAALYLAADVLVVTSLRDGMNLVAKEYLACRSDEQGVLVLSEFTGAADELRRALLVNPHDIDGLKAAMLQALRMPPREQRQRMKALRKVVFRNDVARWSGSFLRAVAAQAAQWRTHAAETDPALMVNDPVFLSPGLDSALLRLSAEQSILVASDFDGTLAPIVPRPDDARMLPRAERALATLNEAPGVRVALISGRSLESLRATGVHLDEWIVAGSHGAELMGLPGTELAAGELRADERGRLARLTEVLQMLVSENPGAQLEFKPYGCAVHVRQVPDENAGDRLLDACAAAVSGMGEDATQIQSRTGKRVLEFSVRRASKGEVLRRIRAEFPDAMVLFIGDDDTDEEALQSLRPGDVGVRVGDAPSVAEYRVADPAAVAALLSRLVNVRTGHVIGSE
ncbi:bifunctional alpha,alpha-trehalose-phosphate synthase (UDP-forming)/trehalose-phosphatase [Leucobacter sp. W1038]|uniref:bifunctional alpha,alpha-trehalose-phosphate synthase (UDP-forming)/trehalose-phosphatase n=1 Tax=Leucobacter sp. W1038 TaxID=3438281 RepID=UPI003D971B46